MFYSQLFVFNNINHVKIDSSAGNAQSNPLGTFITCNGQQSLDQLRRRQCKPVSKKNCKNIFFF